MTLQQIRPPRFAIILVAAVVAFGRGRPVQEDRHRDLLDQPQLEPQRR